MHSRRIEVPADTRPQRRARYRTAAEQQALDREHNLFAEHSMVLNEDDFLAHYRATSAAAASKPAPTPAVPAVPPPPLTRRQILACAAIIAGDLLLLVALAWYWHQGK